MLFVLFKTTVQIIRYAKLSPPIFAYILSIKSFNNYEGFLVDRLNSKSFQDPRGTKERTIFCVAKQGDMPALYFFRRDNDNDENNGQKAPSANDDDYHGY